MAADRETLTYEDFGRAARELAQQVADDGFEPDLDLTGAKALVADDVADTGKTLELVREFCAGHVADVRSAVVYEKSRSVVRCDYVWKRTDAWIDFPWSTLPPVVDRRGGPGHQRPPAGPTASPRAVGCRGAFVSSGTE